MNANRTHTLRPLAAAIALALSAPAGAAVIPVDGTTCTLGDAITAANTDAAVGGCAAGTDADTLNLTAPAFKPAAPLAAITGVVTINGDPDGNGTNATIYDATITINGGNLSLNNVILKNKNPVGTRAIGVLLYGGTLTLTRSTISTKTDARANEGIGIDVEGGSATITHSTISGNWIGVTCSYYSVCHVSSSHISGNQFSGIDGGDGSRASVTDSTISGNGRGISIGTGDIVLSRVTVSNNLGTGISTHDSDLSLSNTTVSGNGGTGLQFTRGVWTDYNTALILNSTIAGNGGAGLDIKGHATRLIGSVFTDNRRGDCSVDVSNLSGSLGGNLIGDGSCEAAARGALTGDAKLGPLKDNGGPTFTHALLKDSPALDAAPASTCEATDQRGAARPQRAACDIGAYESVTRRPPVLRPLLRFFDQAVQAGTLVRTLKAPNRWHRLQAVRRQLLLAGDLQVHGSKTGACKQTGHTLGRIDADGATPDANDYVTGAAAPELATKLRALRTDLGCS